MCRVSNGIEAIRLTKNRVRFLTVEGHNIPGFIIVGYSIERYNLYIVIGREHGVSLKQHELKQVPGTHKRKEKNREMGIQKTNFTSCQDHQKAHVIAAAAGSGKFPARPQ